MEVSHALPSSLPHTVSQQSRKRLGVALWEARLCAKLYAGKNRHSLGNETAASDERHGLLFVLAFSTWLAVFVSALSG